MNFAATHHFNMSANFHGGAELLNYPWDTWVTSGNPNCDAAWWERVCTAYVDTTRLVNPTYLSSTFPDGVTEGGDWYIITGGRQDYMNYFHHCREVTIELDDTKTTPTENLNAQWNQNYNSLINYIQESIYGVRGIITDSCSGLPVRAKVWVNGYDQVNDSSQVYSALPLGNYHKYMIAGTYSITYSAPGYTSKTITGVVLANGAATIRNIQLAPTAAPDAQFTATLTGTCSGSVQFNNTTSAATSYTWYFGDGSTSAQANPVHTYATNGTYSVKLIAGNCKGIDSLVRTNYITINMLSAPTVVGGSHCGPGTVNLSAAGTGTINWYDAASGGNLLYTGMNFTTPTLSSTTTYYAANSITLPSEYMGKTDSVGGGAMYNSTSYYLKFDCNSAVTLKSVKVYAGAAGNRTIALRNSSGSVLQSDTINIPAGESRITLHFSIPVGTNLQLAITSANPNLYRSTGGIVFPYVLSNKISITGTNAANLRYYFFYDWEIETPNGCISSLVPVTANILSNPVPGFSSAINNNTVDFTNTTTGATSYQWTFGDGGSSTQFSPSYTYTTTGTFTVQLISFNGGCSDSISHDVIITTVGGVGDRTFAGMSVFPNPSQDKLSISFGSENKKSFSVEIFTLSGAKIYYHDYRNITGPITIDLSSFAEGIYNLVLGDEAGRRHFKVVKIK
jgi:PKD repeat protein